MPRKYHNRNIKSTYFFVPLLQVGANFLETVVRKFDEVYKNPTEGKECDNLMAIIGHLYNFQVVHSLIITDILKLMIGAFTEKDVELVLFLLRNVGFSLRKDDPLALKELISEGQRKASDLGSKFQDQTRVGAISCHALLYFSLKKAFARVNNMASVLNPSISYVKFWF